MVCIFNQCFDLILYCISYKYTAVVTVEGEKRKPSHFPLVVRFEIGC